ncbi:dihydroneopterin aldolase [Arcobacter aquimarinus]|uniref:dihydroneopterin aldolase n=1 Tax=Arcobacter aquimarinus TaxID=1315211 RepID=A0AAE7E2H0_9BACT|nr:dihydroneopterin aldolase [Arcobacter aquimarinus]QKE26947.1 dihydroneopterin aldolase [Arcobacter aquimarinus]RXI36051.1 dihydroneopterin aldolase [Arcobacter aquimarinus]
MKIEISNLTFKCIIGILDFERIKKQKVVIDLSFEYEFSKDIFINYADVANLVEKTMKKEKFLLLEDAILYLERLLNKTYTITNLKIKISKPNILKNCVVSLQN